MIPSAFMVASWMALAGVVTTCCMPGTEGQRALMEKGMGEGDRTASTWARFCRYFRRYLVRTGREVILYGWSGLPQTSVQAAADRAPPGPKQARVGGPAMSAERQSAAHCRPDGPSPKSLTGGLGNDDSTHPRAPQVIDTTAT
jgi:hypothetical protein